jgi:hypothetical protein
MPLATWLMIDDKHWMLGEINWRLLYPAVNAYDVGLG